MRNKFHNYIENILSFYSTFFTRDITVFKYHSIHNDCNATKLIYFLNLYLPFP